MAAGAGVISRMRVSLRRFFFFQAEDGIRDKLVTGVQTCALPIYVGQRIDRAEALADPARLEGRRCRGGGRRCGLRSEERRVGKECRSRGSPYHSMKRSTELRIRGH